MIRSTWATAYRPTFQSRRGVWAKGCDDSPNAALKSLSLHVFHTFHSWVVQHRSMVPLTNVLTHDVKSAADRTTHIDLICRNFACWFQFLASRHCVTASDTSSPAIMRIRLLQTSVTHKTVYNWIKPLPSHTLKQSGGQSAVSTSSVEYFRLPIYTWLSISVWAWYSALLVQSACLWRSGPEELTNRAQLNLTAHV